MAGDSRAYLILPRLSHPTPILPHPTLDSTAIPSYLTYLILTDRVGWGRIGKKQPYHPAYRLIAILPHPTNTNS